MLSSRLLDHVFVSRVSQTRDNKRGVRTHLLTDARKAGYPLHHVYFLWFNSHETRTYDLTDARRACYPLHHVYCLWFDSHGTRTHDPLDVVFVSRVSQTRDHNRGVKGSMLSSRLLDHVFVSRVSQTRDCYPLHHVYFLWFDSHRTRTHHLTDARRACYLASVR
jgi:hypothetical protein